MMRGIDGRRWMPGATVTREGVEFSVWAPAVSQVDLIIEGRADPIQLASEPDGLHQAAVSGAAAGDRYRFLLDGYGPFPDPYSRFQPDGVHGTSEVIDPGQFKWTDADWPGATMTGMVLYELHIGTFTPEGTFRAAIEQLQELKNLGVTTIELMPVASFPGRWNWGYDGVDLYAPTANYGRPDDLRALVNAAHRVGLGVLLDVVYNHLGPDGNYLRSFSEDYFTDHHTTPWGDAINYDGPNSRRVRDFVIDNACMWIAEYHFDGLRLDATDTIKDDSRPHILQELAEAARKAAGDRSIVIIAEDAKNDTGLIRGPESGGYGLDAAWADDFHHVMHVALTGGQENYYADYTGTPGEITQTIEQGHLYRGQRSSVTGEPRGTEVSDEPAEAFVFCLQNHDQIGNRPLGERLHHLIDRERYAVASALLLFAPETPQLFMGQEFASSSPFVFFSDHHDELGRLVTEGRRNEFSGYKAFHHHEIRHLIPDPQSPRSFNAAVLDFDERQMHSGIYNLYRDLLHLRRNDPVLQIQDRARTKVTTHGFITLSVLRWTDQEQRLLIANFGAGVDIPLERSLETHGNGSEEHWNLLLASSSNRYGGSGKLPRLELDRSEPRIVMPARTAAIWAVDEAIMLRH
jgi:maltooligosyltrehalose trehalohydrolase